MHKKNLCYHETTIGLLVSYPIYRKSLKIYFTTKLHHTLRSIFRNFKLGFRKGFYPQNYLVAIILKFRNSLDQGDAYTALLTDVTKALICLLHDLIISKLHVYGFDMTSLRLIQSYSTDRYQRVKVNNSYYYKILSL